ncbi:hypothetical protein ACIF80_30730 [Streptomyces sp. NPDC085927]|uniref:hypothetical protein n=1 Tax=Streptomyces sp. NPDC085927 TaxID=3365738 RepID=UPI0037D75E50
MHDYHKPGRLASFADLLAGELPGAWGSIYHPPDHTNDLAELSDRVWDMDLVAESLTTHPLKHGAVLTREDGAQLIVLDRHDERDGFLIAAVAPRNIPAEAFRGLREPDGIALNDDPFLSAGSVARDLLARYDASLAQVRNNAADTQEATAEVRPSQPDRVVLAWQADGSLAAAGVTASAADVLLANGFIHDEQSGIYRLSSNDSAALACAVHQTAIQLDARGITAAVQHQADRSTPTATAPAAAFPPRTRTASARTR